MCSLFSTSSYKKNVESSQSGFGMIELLISISIIVVVTSVILVRQTSFNGAVLLRSQAYEVALQIRDVQLSAVSASYDGASYRSVVGLHFDDNPGNNNTYRIFSDSDSGANDDNFYQASEEFGIQGLLDPRFEIRDIRVVGDTYTDSDGLSIVFLRPDFDAEFTDAGGNLDASSVEVDIARIGAAGSGPADVRTIEITATGQISVN